MAFVCCELGEDTTGCFDECCFGVMYVGRCSVCMFCGFCS